MKNNLFYIISGFIVLILVFLCLITTTHKEIYKSISYEKFENLKTGLVYFGELDSEVKKIMKKYDQSFTIDEYVVSDYEIDKLNTLLSNNKVNTIDNTGYVFINDNVPVWSSNKSLDEKDLTEELNKQLNGVLKSSEIVYKQNEKMNDIINLINSKKYTILVVGKEGCSWCTRYQPVINNVVKDYNVDIHYIDKTKYSESDFKKYKDLALEIKAKCTNDGVATTTKTFGDYPLTLITKNGKSVDCLMGYESEETVIELLRKYNIIK